MRMSPQSGAGTQRRAIGARAGAAPGSGARAGVRSRRRATLILPGYLQRAGHYTQMAEALMREVGGEVGVAQVQGWEWWPTLAGGAFSFYLEAVDVAAQQLMERAGADSLSLVGHSAGGWLARAWMGEERYNGRRWGRAPWVDALVTLGTPHLSIEAYPFGRVPERRFGEREDLSQAAMRSSLAFVNECYPAAGCFPGVDITCVCGRLDASGTEEAGSFARASYKATCGREEVPGDGVCPLESASIPGASELFLDGVFHDRKERQSAAAQPWYGDPAVLRRWCGSLPGELEN